MLIHALWHHLIERFGKKKNWHEGDLATRCLKHPRCFGL
jgi:hypothetical protein